MGHMARNALAISIACTAAMAHTAIANEHQTTADDGWFVGAHIKHAEFDGERNDAQGNESRRGQAYGITLGKDLSEHFALRATVSSVNVNTDGIGADESGLWYATDLLYRINSGRNYLLLGADYLDLDSDSTQAARLGFGMRYPITAGWALTGEAIGHYGWDERTTDFSVGVGIQYRFGAPQTVVQTQRPLPVFVKNAPKDSDHDSVFDSFDECPDTPTGYVVDKRGCTLYRDETISKQLMVNFAHNSSVVPSDALTDIEDLAIFLTDYPQLDVVIEGHTSSVGETDYNQWLSEERANAIASVLVERFGIDADRVQAKGLGETTPLLRGDSEKIHAANRRIMALLSAKTKVGIRK